MGLGFKSDWSPWEYSLLDVLQGLVYVLCLPSWFLVKVQGPYGGNAVIVMAQLIYSFFQAVVIHGLLMVVFARNKRL